MEHADTAQMLAQLMCPAFTVEGGVITDANQAALQRQIQLNTAISDLICIGKDEYESYTQGKLCLTLCIEGIQYHTTVCAMQDYHLFCLTTDYESPELRALALAAEQLRQPLAKAMYGTDQLLPNANLREDPEAAKYLSQVNRSLHQLLRAVCNMSDTAQYAKAQRNNMPIVNAVKTFEEILQKAEDLVAKAERTLDYTVPKQLVNCPLDEKKVERAILNLISNAIKFTPIGSKINANLHHKGNFLLFTVQDSGQGADAKIKNNMFTRYLREPAIENERSGIGLGLSIVHSVAAAHGGTVLIEHPEDAGLKITMTISLNPPSNNILRSPIKLPVDYAGGYDCGLLELSDVLPDDLYLENI